MLQKVKRTSGGPLTKLSARQHPWPNDTMSDVRVMVRFIGWQRTTFGWTWPFAAARALLTAIAERRDLSRYVLRCCRPAEPGDRSGGGFGHRKSTMSPPLLAGMSCLSFFLVLSDFEVMLKGRKGFGSPRFQCRVFSALGVTLEKVDGVFMDRDLIFLVLFDEFRALQLFQVIEHRGARSWSRRPASLSPDRFR